MGVQAGRQRLHRIMIDVSVRRRDGVHDGDGRGHGRLGGGGGRVRHRRLGVGGVDEDEHGGGLRWRRRVGGGAGCGAQASDRLFYEGNEVPRKRKAVKKMSQHGPTPRGRIRKGKKDK